MQIGAFEIREPLPAITSPHVIATLRPWVDAGSVGSLIMRRLRQYMGAVEVGRLARPGQFFDFTRYRPSTSLQNGQRHLTVPNTVLRYAPGSEQHDFLLIDVLEPHALAEDYIDSILTVLQHLGIQRYCRIGAWYGATPHTRPLPVTANRNGQPFTGISGVTHSRMTGSYQGRTTIMSLLNDRLRAMSVEDMTLMVQLPYYVELEEDYTGASHLYDALASLYGFPRQLSAIWQGNRQYDAVTARMDTNSELKTLVQRLEQEHDARKDPAPEEESQAGGESAQLPLSVEEFLKELDEDGEASSGGNG